MTFAAVVAFVTNFFQKIMLLYTPFKATIAMV